MTQVDILRRKSLRQLIYTLSYMQVKSAQYASKKRQVSVNVYMCS